MKKSLRAALAASSVVMAIAVPAVAAQAAPVVIDQGHVDAVDVGYETSTFGTPTVKFNTADGLPDTFAVPSLTHAHGNWASRPAGRGDSGALCRTPTNLVEVQP